MKFFVKTLFVVFALAALHNRASGREIYSLNDNWKFFFRNENSSDEARSVTLPHTWAFDLRNNARAAVPATADYIRDLYIPSEWSGKRIFLRFGGAQNVADVFVNGRYAGEHRGSFTAFTLEITDKVRFDYNNSLHVMVSNYPQNDILPLSSEMNAGGGLTREVELIVTDPVTVRPDYYGTDGVLVNQFTVNRNTAEGSVTVHIAADKPAAPAVQLTIKAPDGYTVVKKNHKLKAEESSAVIPFSIHNPALWSPSNPNLYKVQVTVGGDTVEVMTGFRSIDVSSEELFRLNGKTIPVRGVTLYHDCAGHGSALTCDDCSRDLDMICDMGANAIRSATAPHDPALYDLCDRRGIMVWIDFPLTQAPFPGDKAFIPSERLMENGRRQVREIITQNYNRPSVVMWGLFSLLRGSDDILDYLRELNDMTHRLDPSRPTVACSNRDGDINFISDLIVWQQNFGWEKGSISDLELWQSVLDKNWRNLRHGVAYGPNSAQGLSESPSAAKVRERLKLPFGDRQKLFHEGYTEQLADSKIFWGVWLNEMFDFASERYRNGINDGGVVMHDHATPKDIYYLYRSVWNESSPTLHIIAPRNPDPVSPEHCVEFYSSVENPSLTVNGEAVNIQKAGPTRYISEKVPMHGRCEVKVEAAGASETALFTIGNSAKPR
ncbi:MAG: beta-galactosidase [Alistipes sp.]|nr:beta-galactosidase [Alistipes sp.]